MLEALFALVLASAGQEEPPSSEAEKSLSSPRPSHLLFGGPQPPRHPPLSGRLELRHLSPVVGVAFAGEDQLLSAEAGGGIRCWDRARAFLPSTGPVPVGHVIHAFATHPTSGLLALGSGGLSGKAAPKRAKLHVLSLPLSGAAVSSQDIPGTPSSLAFDLTGHRLAVGFADGSIGLVFTKEPRPPVFWTAHTSAVTGACFGTGTDDLLTVGADGMLRKWDLTTRSERYRQKVGLGPVSVLAARPDGRLLATSGGDRIVRLWEAASGAEVVRFERHEGWVPALAWSPDGRFLASGGYDGMVWIHDLKSGSAIPAPAAGWVTSLAYSSDGRHLAAGRSDGVVAVWRCPEPSGRQDAAPDSRSLEALWEALGDPDPAPARRALGTLVLRLSQESSRGPVHDLLASHLAAGIERHLQSMVKDLDSEDPGRRERAEEELLRLGATAEPVLRQALKDGGSVEQRARIAALLDTLVTVRHHEPERLRLLRALEALEEAGTDQARTLLESVAERSPGSNEALDAKAAVERLQRRAKR